MNLTPKGRSYFDISFSNRTIYIYIYEEEEMTQSFRTRVEHLFQLYYYYIILQHTTLSNPLLSEHNSLSHIFNG